MSTIAEAELVQRQPHEILRVRTDEGRQEIPLVIHPRVESLPYILPALRRMREDTERQLEMLQYLAGTPGGLKRVGEPYVATVYCAQRADLIGYHRMLAVWQETQSDPLIKGGLGQWLGMLDEIDAHTKALLEIIVSALGARW
jgi:hypothetical protein